MNGRIAHLSLAALRLAASGLSTDADGVAQWLYRFGTIPRGPAIDRDFGADDAPMAVLRLTAGDHARRLLESAYEPTSFPGWYSFVWANASSRIVPACKLYVSPRPEALSDVFPRIVETFIRFEVPSFKVGRGVEGILRPDKIMAYFHERPHMHAVAGALEKVLRRCSVQGVPFTADIGGDGLLSWGIDPPPGSAAVSWRAWVTKCLATALAEPSARRSRDPVTSVLARVRALGVDPETWHASADVFREEASS